MPNSLAFRIELQLMKRIRRHYSAASRCAHIGREEAMGTTAEDVAESAAAPTAATGSAVEKLTSLVHAPDRYNYSPDELRATQIEAINERFQDRKDRIKLLGHRAEEANISEVRSLEEVVPLLFPHTAYKSYPEGGLMQERRDRLDK